MLSAAKDQLGCDLKNTAEAKGAVWAGSESGAGVAGLQTLPQNLRKSGLSSYMKIYCSVVIKRQNWLQRAKKKVTNIHTQTTSKKCQ